MHKSFKRVENAHCVLRFSYQKLKRQQHIIAIFIFFRFVFNFFFFFLTSSFWLLFLTTSLFVLFEMRLIIFHFSILFVLMHLAWTNIKINRWWTDSRILNMMIKQIGIRKLFVVKLRMQLFHLPCLFAYIFLST